MQPVNLEAIDYKDHLLQEIQEETKGLRRSNLAIDGVSMEKRQNYSKKIVLTADKPG